MSDIRNSLEGRKVKIESAENWYEQLGRAVAQEVGLTEGSPIEHQCGTVWVEEKDGTYAISGNKCENDDEE
jgi:hypothetical protein